MSNFETIENKSSKKIIDCFTFYNEMDLLTYRLNILNDVVDYFVIVEATHTFIGKEKMLFFNENKHLFEKFHEKIIHIIVDDFPYKYPNINIYKSEQWVNENFQRDQIKRGLDKLDLNDEDIITITDLDEIPDPNTLLKIKNNEIKIELNTLSVDFYYYNLNSKIYNEVWNKTKIISFKKYKELSISCNSIRHIDCQYIDNGGWHLSYFGDSKFIKNKIEQFAHQEYNNDHYTNIEKIETRVKSFSDLYDRNGNIVKTSINDNTYLPPEYDKYLTKFIVE
jgi:beta-1,4-mannosyl-glycoprotein beta-1,4-N-acetylglucosaminyltransferase